MQRDSGNQCRDDVGEDRSGDVRSPKRKMWVGRWRFALQMFRSFSDLDAEIRERLQIVQRRVLGKRMDTMRLGKEGECVRSQRGRESDGRL